MRSPTPVPARRAGRQIDIPLDDGEKAQAVSRGAAAQPEKKSLFNKKPGVRTPDEVLMPPAAAPAPAAVTPAAEPEPQPEIVREPAVVKVKPEEVEIEAAGITKSIEKTLDTVPSHRYPPVSLLNTGPEDGEKDGGGEIQANKERLEDTIHSFGIDANVIHVVRGPTVTRFELELDRGVKLNKLTNLADDIALALGVSGVRIAPIPDKISVVGIEVPNRKVSTVYARDVIDSPEFRNHRSKIAFAIGRDIAGSNIVGDISKLPHLLIAGTTGSGKSVCMNTIIVSLLYKATPEEVRLIMIDPKMIELGVYNGIPHLLIPVVTDPNKAAGALQWAVSEMMKRYRLFSEIGARDIASYNAAAAKDPERQKLPQIVIVIDELADLMLVAAKEVEESVCRIAQMARAAGMHLIIATQRPSADVITGIMKANNPRGSPCRGLRPRIAQLFGQSGRRKNGGTGRYALFSLGVGKPIRIQGCMITGEEWNPRVVRQGERDRGLHDEVIGKSNSTPNKRREAALRQRAGERLRRGRRAASCRGGSPAGNGAGLGFHAPAAAEAWLFARGPSGGPDGGTGNCRAV